MDRTCVNDCVRRVVDGGEPVPKEVVRGRLCGSCLRRLADWLEDIPVDYALLPMVQMSLGSQRMDGTSRTKQTEAPVPGRLDVASLTDRRPSAPLRESGDELWYELEDIPRVLPVIYWWSERLRCDLDPQRTPKRLDDKVTLYAEIRYLLGAFDRLVDAVWVGQAMAEIKVIWVALTRVHGLISGPPVGPCLKAECDGKVFRNRFTGFPECNACHKVYQGLDTLKIQLTEEAATG